MDLHSRRSAAKRQAAHIKSLPNYLRDRALVNELYTYFCADGDQAGKRQLLKDLSTRGGWGDQRLTDRHADQRYVAALASLLPCAFVEHVVEHNRHSISDDDGERILDSISASRADLDDYIEIKADLVRIRHEQEYRFVQNMEFPYFPYCYLSDYVRVNTLPRSSLEPIAVDFVFCIKNRKRRALAALRSLDQSLANYLNHYRASISVRAIVVEGLSGDMLDLAAEKCSALAIEHLIVDIGDRWTRSALLNCGIRQSSADLIAMVDADFLFHRGFVAAFARVLRSVDFGKNVLAVNMFETETHVRDQQIVSEGSPYSYMWVVSRAATLGVSGFDEGYWGHGFEDRDFEMKLRRAAGLSVCDSYSIDKECFVLHLSHTARTGTESRMENKARFMQRKSAAIAELQQDTWGDLSLIVKRAFSPADSPDPISVVDVEFLLVPHKRDHSLTMQAIRDGLLSRGYSAKLLDLNPVCSNEGAVIDKFVNAYCGFSNFLGGRLVAKAVVCVNDWESRIVQPFVTACDAAGVPTIGIVEGVNDFHNVDLGCPRTTYRNVGTVLLNGRFDRRYFTDSVQKIRVCGLERLDALLRRAPSHQIERSRPVALADINFVNGINSEDRESWLRDVRDASVAAGYDLKVLQHSSDDGDLSQYDRDTRPFIDALSNADVFISRFGGGVLEALVLGKSVVYYNPGFEKMGKFSDPLGAYIYARDRLDLGRALSAYSSGYQLDAGDFLETHADVERAGCRPSSAEKVVDVLIHEVLDASPTATGWRQATCALNLHLEKIGITHGSLLDAHKDQLQQTRNPRS